MECWAHYARDRRSRRQVIAKERDLCLHYKNTTVSLSVYNTTDSMIRRVLPNGRIPHICIVGAGISGLRCAELLVQQGLKVTILEGRDRIGGRVSRCLDGGEDWLSLTNIRSTSSVNRAI